MRKIRVLIVDQTGINPSEHQKYDKLANYVDLDVNVLVPKKWVSNYRMYYYTGSQGKNYQVHAIPVLFPGRGHRSFYLSTLRNVFRKVRPDVIHLFQEPFSLFALQMVICHKLFAPRTKLLFITWENLNHQRYPFAFSAFYKWVEKLTYKTAHFATPITENAKQILHVRGYSGKCKVINWGINHELFIKIDSLELRKSMRLQNSFVIGFIGRFVEEKGVTDLVRAVSGLKKKVSLLLIGDGPLKSEITSLAQSLKIDDRVHIIPTVPNAELNPYLNCLDLLVLPSKPGPYWEEQLGRVVLEAMACEVPVIGSDSGEIPNLIRQPELIFKAGDYNDLSNKIESVINSSINISAFVADAKNRVQEQYSWQNVAACIHESYVEVISDKDNNRDLVSLSRKSRFISLLRPPSPSLNLNRKKVTEIVKNAQIKSERVLDIGSGGRRLSKGVIAIDIERFKNVDILGRAQRLPIRSNSIGLVVISAVLEHLQDPLAVSTEIYRVLKDGGIVYVENPFLQPFHADPDDFNRFTMEGLKYQFKDFEIIDAGVCVGPFSAVAFFIRKFVTILFVNPYQIKLIEFLAGWLTFWIKYFDWLVIRAKRLHVVAAGIYLLARK